MRGDSHLEKDYQFLLLFFSSIFFFFFLGGWGGGWGWGEGVIRNKVFVYFAFLGEDKLI